MNKTYGSLQTRNNDYTNTTTIFIAVFFSEGKYEGNVKRW